MNNAEGDNRCTFERPKHRGPFPLHGAFANILFEKQILTPEELARKMDEVEAR
jgi:hypothetical protein